MNHKRNLVLLLAVVAVAIGAFCVTVAIGQSQPADQYPRGAAQSQLVRWLGLEGEDAEAVAGLEETFRSDMRRLDHQLQIEQHELAMLVEDEDTGDEALMQQFEQLGEAHLAIHTRIAEFIVAVRPYLDSEQRAQFLHMLAQQVRGEGPGGPGGPEGPGGPGMQGGPPQGHQPPPGPMGPGGMHPPPRGSAGWPPPQDGQGQEQQSREGQ